VKKRMKTRHIIIGFFLVEILIFVCNCKSPPSIPETTDMIAFSVWSVTGEILDSDICIIKSDGSNKLQLTWSREHWETSPCWLTDNKLAYVSSTQEKTYGEGRIDLIDLKEGKRKTAYKAPGPASAIEFDEITTFFKDNKKILVNTGDWIFYTVDIVTRDTAEVTCALSHGVWRFQHPRVSPDGNSIVFTGVDKVKKEFLPRYPTGFIQLSDSLNDIYIYDIEDGGVSQITNTNSCDYGPAWFPDGEHIVFSSNREGNFELYTMRKDGSNLERLTYTEDRDEVDPVCAPDGKRIAFVVKGKGMSARMNTRTTIWVMNIDGTGLKRLTEGSEPAWSPKSAHD